MDQNQKNPASARRVAVAVRGVVQGVGFRPFVYNLARLLGLVGWIRNEADTVRIDVQGETPAVAAFLELLHTTPPPQARIDLLDVQDLPCQAEPPPLFEILPSDPGAAPQPVIPADLATCPQCVAEIFDPLQRRHRYPFTNCTNCGPRWSIIERLPYDRPYTAMKTFALCEACRAEYINPADRRFHAQPIACPHCGPSLELVDPQGRCLARREAALDAAADALREGKIIALKGLGGFQLLVDATDGAAVERLRLRKHRPDRPLAIMIATLEEVRRHCHVSDEEAQLLASPQAPIVLLLRKNIPSSLTPHPSSLILHPSSFIPHPSPLSATLAPGNPYLGVMLPYTPLHHLLLSGVGRPVVCTSGNLSEEPMAVTNDEALKRLGPIADALLWHDRPIVRPVDDSVVRSGPTGVQILRRARGYAPLPLKLELDAPAILALGGHLKNTVAISLGKQKQKGCEGSEGFEATTPVVLSSHIGDLDNQLSVEVFRRAAADLCDFFRVHPAAVACDLHPDYASTREAESLAARWNVPRIRVQHHHAHVAACMAEHALTGGPVLGLAWDGTGYGPDGTIWGGEALVCQAAEFRRVAFWRTFPLPGGDRAVREPRRSALGLLFEILGPQATAEVQGWFTTRELKTLLAMLDRATNCPRTSSVGRLFDAVAALCGLHRSISFEGQAAMALEFAAEDADVEPYPLEIKKPPPDVRILDWEPMIRAILADRAAGVPPGRISARFHQTLVAGAVEIAKIVGLPGVILSGGCFQNALLLRKMAAALQAAGHTVYTHQQVPPGDGGIALGQIYVAAQKEIPKKDEG